MPYAWRYILSDAVRTGEHAFDGSAALVPLTLHCVRKAALPAKRAAIQSRGSGSGKKATSGGWVIQNQENPCGNRSTSCPHPLSLLAPVDGGNVDPRSLVRRQVPPQQVLRDDPSHFIVVDKGRFHAEHGSGVCWRLQNRESSAMDLAQKSFYFVLTNTENFSGDRRRSPPTIIWRRILPLLPPYPPRHSTCCRAG